MNLARRNTLSSALGAWSLLFTLTIMDPCVTDYPGYCVRLHVKLWISSQTDVYDGRVNPGVDTRYSLQKFSVSKKMFIFQVPMLQ